MKYKVGDEIECIDNNSGRFLITIGQKYTITGIAKNEKGFYVTNDDYDEDTFYYQFRFKPETKEHFTDDLFKL
jgi:hypothetical protein